MTDSHHRIAMSSTKEKITAQAHRTSVQHTMDTANALDEAAELREFLRDVETIVEEIATEMSGSLDLEIVVDSDDVTASTSHASGTAIEEDDIVVGTPVPQATAVEDAPVPSTTSSTPSASMTRAPTMQGTETAFAFAQEPAQADSNPYGKWYRQEADSISSWRSRPSRLQDPPVSIIPAAAACVLFLLVASWSQLRRSRRRVLERHDSDWASDMDLMEAGCLPRPN